MGESGLSVRVTPFPSEMPKAPDLIRAQRDLGASGKAFSHRFPGHLNVLTSSVSAVGSLWKSLRRFETRPLSRQYIPQRSHGPRGITFPDIERGANKDLMASQLLQIHIKDVPSSCKSRWQVWGGGVLITWVVQPPHRRDQTLLDIKTKFQSGPCLSWTFSYPGHTIILSITSDNF